MKIIPAYLVQSGCSECESTQECQMQAYNKKNLSDNFYTKVKAYFLENVSGLNTNRIIKIPKQDFIPCVWTIIGELSKHKVIEDKQIVVGGSQLSGRIMYFLIKENNIEKLESIIGLQKIKNPTVESKLLGYNINIEEQSEEMKKAIKALQKWVGTK